MPLNAQELRIGKRLKTVSDALKVLRVKLGIFVYLFCCSTFNY
jgi:hypothetical protein